MKHLFFMLGFLFFTSICYSQSSNQSDVNLQNKINTFTSVSPSIQKSYTPKRSGERIQTTNHGVVVAQQDYTPEYPTRLFEPKSDPLINPASND